MNNIKFLGLSLAVISMVSFSGCGSDSADDVVDALTNPDSIVPTGGSDVVEPSGSYDCESSVSHNGINLTMKLSATGKLTCSKEYGYPAIQFAEGVNEITVTQLVSTQTFATDIGKGTSTMDLQAGTEHIVGTHTTYGSADCVVTYDVNLPLNVYDANELEEFTFNNFQELSNTCPDWLNEDNTQPTSMSLNSKTTITDDSNSVSTISLYRSF